MNTTVHPFAPEEIMAFVDGELSADRAQSISAHIDQCAECAQLAAQVRSASQVLTKWRVDAPSASVQEHVLSATSNSTSLFVQSQHLLSRLRVFCLVSVLSPQCLWRRRSIGPCWKILGLALRPAVLFLQQSWTVPTARSYLGPMTKRVMLSFLVRQTAVRRPPLTALP
jgi:hypothetical protein